MRARLAVLIAAVVALGITPVMSLPALAAPAPQGIRDVGAEDIHVAQGQEESEETDQPSESGAAEEGPPWTYQMARLAIVLLAVTVLGVAAAYWKFVYTRKRSGA